jgi:molybdenum cofactor cytidylyltransferase
MATPSKNATVGLLLAAGASQRFGSDKLLTRLADGQPIAVAAASTLRPACDRLIAVIRPGAEELALLLTKAGCEIVVAADAVQGMGTSLATGVRATADANGWIVALADMPYIGSHTHQRVRNCLQAGASLVATQYHQRRGHPVGFARTWFSQLTALTGDQGGKTLLQNNAHQLTLCEVDDPGVLRDIDEVADLNHVFERD